MDPIASAKFLCRRFSDRRVHVDRINCFYIRVFVHNTADRAEHMVYRFSQVFPTVCGDHDKTAVRPPFQLGMGVVIPDGGFQRVDGGIPGNVDALRPFAFPEQVIPRLLRRGKIVLCKKPNGLSVKLFRIYAPK